MKVSVVTTVYNGEAYFDRAVPSILRQTYNEFEWVIINDGSTDRTQELLDDVASMDSRVRVFNFGRMGRTMALNKAVELSRGEYIVEQDFDDISYAERLKRQVDFLNSHPEVGVVGAYYIVVDENRTERYIRQPPAEHEAILRAMARSIPFAHTLVAFRKVAWEQAGGYPQVEDIEDLRLWIRFAVVGWKLRNIPEVLGEHFVHGQSYWHRNFQYAGRQRELAMVQWQAIQELGLPEWMAIYPLGRLVYPYISNPTKRFIRWVLGKSQEQDV